MSFDWMSFDWLRDLPTKELKLAAKEVAKESRRFSEHMVRLRDEAFADQAARSSRPLIEVWRSRNYLCQIYDEGEVERLSICRAEVDVNLRRWRDGLTWDELQQVKSEVGRGPLCAVEIYPPDDRVVNVANQRHIWVWKAKCPLEFIW